MYENGRSGFLGEHSCMDGTPTLRLNEFVLASIALNKIPLGETPADLAPAGLLDAPKELVFGLGAGGAVEKAVREAEGRFDELVGAHDLEVRWQLRVPYPY